MNKAKQNKKKRKKDTEKKKNWLEASLKSRTTTVARPTKIDLFAQFQALNPTIQLCEAIGGRMHDCMALCLSMRTKIKVKTRDNDTEQQNNEGETGFFFARLACHWCGSNKPVRPDDGKIK